MLSEEETSRHLCFFIKLILPGEEMREMKEETIRLAAAGDILITKRIPEENSGVAPIRKFLERADVRLANLETTVTTEAVLVLLFPAGPGLQQKKTA